MRCGIISEAQTEARTALVSTASHVRGEIDIAETVRQRIQFQEEKTSQEHRRYRRPGCTATWRQGSAGTLSPTTTGPHASSTTYRTSHLRRCNFCGARYWLGEIERPGSTSIRGLNILRNLDQQAASLFRSLCSLIVSLVPDGNHIMDSRVPALGGNAGTNALQAYGLDFNALNTLNEHGLIIADYNSWHDYRVCIGIVVPNVRAAVRIPFRFQGQYWVLEPHRSAQYNQ